MYASMGRLQDFSKRNAFICEIAFLTCNVIGSVYQQLNESHHAMVRENREYLKVLIDVVLFLSKQELAGFSWS